MSTDFDTITIRVKADSHMVSKADECDIITSLSEFFEDKELYLTDLFNKRMTAWTVNTIMADVCPDVYAEWMHEKDNADHHRDVVNDRDSHIHTLQLEAKERDHVNSELKLTIGERDDMLFKMQERIDGVSDERDDLAEGVLIYAKEADEHEAEINKLKAQMFDLMSSHTARTELIQQWGLGGGV